MKKLLSILIAASMLFTFFALSSLAEDAGDKVLVATYDGSYEPGQWLNKFDEDDAVIAYSYCAFNAGAPFTDIVFPEIYAGKSAEDRDCDARFELFGYTSTVAAALETEPVFKTDLHFDGDIKDYSISLGKAFPAGQYVLKIAQTSDKGPDEQTGRYVVLPRAHTLYDNERLEFGGKAVSDDFAFALNFVKTEGVTDYFAPFSAEQLPQFKDDRPVTIVARKGDNPVELNQFGEFGILTPEIPEGKVLRYFIFKNSCTWNNVNGDSDLGFEVYRWDSDYDTSYKGRPLVSGTVEGHLDNQDLILDFGARLKGGSRYLIITMTENDGKVGFWSGDTISKEGWEFFADGDESDYLPSCQYRLSTYTGPEITEEPTPEETPTPEVTEAPDPTEVAEDPTKDPAGEPTKVPEPTAEPTAEPLPAKKGCGGMVGGAFAALALIAAASFVLKKKD